MKMASGWRWADVAPRGLTLLSALGVAAALPPWDLQPLLWVALVPWLVALQRTRSTLAAAGQGAWLAFFVGLLAAPWLAVALREFLLVPWPVAGLGLLLFAGLAAQPHFVLFAPLFRWFAARGAGRQGAGAALLGTATLALAYVGFDSFVPRFFDVGLGVGLHEAARLRQLADLGGVPLLTFLVALVNLSCWQALASLTAGGAGRRVALASLGLAALFLIAGLGYGEMRARALEARMTAPARMLRAALVQGNVANRDRLAWAAGDDRAAEKQLSAYTLLTEEIIAEAPRPDFVVWPEAAFPGVFGQAKSKAQRGRSAKFDRQVLRLGTPIVFGAYDLGDLGEEMEGAAPALYNTLFLINPNYERAGSLGFVQRYHKHHLLPIAEALPFSQPGSFLHGLLPTVGFFGSGPGPAVLRLAPRTGPAILVNPIICSEALDAGLVAAGARLGSQVILNIGSDGWFGPYGEPEFHLAIARFRSIETRLPQLRAANTGISALILPTGEIAARSALGTRQILEVEVPIEPTRVAASHEHPPYLRGGGYFGPIGGALGIGIVLALGLVRRARL